MEKNTIQIGRELENYVVSKFSELGYTHARRSNGSGNKGEAGDISGVSDFTVECKKRNTKDITIKEDVWKKLKSEVPLHSPRTPIYILENVNKTRLVVLDADDFFEILKERKEC